MNEATLQFCFPESFSSEKMIIPAFLDGQPVNITITQLLKGSVVKIPQSKAGYKTVIISGMCRVEYPGYFSKVLADTGEEVFVKLQKSIRVPPTLRFPEFFLRRTV